MSLAFCILGSGSAGNCTALLAGEDAHSHAPADRDPLAHGLAHPRHELPTRAHPTPGRSCTLLDAGLSPRRTHRLLAGLGRSIDDVAAIVLTHLDTDHFHRGWLRVIARRREDQRAQPLTVHVHRRHRSAAWRSGLTARETALFHDQLELPDGVFAQPVLLAHDDLGSVGFVIEREGHRLGYATDLGRVPRALLDGFVNLHALAIESNYDPPMQRESLRPAFLKRRIMDGRGHLSNEQALEAVRQIERRSRWLSHIALLHLSQECNCPHRVRRLWQRDMPHALGRLTISQQRQPTPLLRVACPPHARTPAPVRQPMLFDLLPSA
jgi:phosphoribosyl 1,2-cyclic phosphodiesterase